MKTILPFAVFLAIATGCAVGPNYRQPELRAPSAFFNAPQGGVTNGAASEWWTGFNDPKLTAIVAAVATNNYELRLAESRLREARALWREARFDFIPTVTADGSFEKSQLSRDAVASGRSRHNELYRAGFDATWELDIWGRVRRSVEAARATIEAVAADRADLLVSLQAEAAANYFELRGFQAQLAVASRNATNQSQIVRLADALLQGGSGTRLDVARARSLLNATLASIPPLEASIARTIHRLSVLSGQPPATLHAELITPAPLPAVIPLNVADPTILLRRRPDVRAAEGSLAAATARIGIEVADLFPRVTFSGSVGLQAQSFSGLGSAGSDTYSFGPRITWAAFDLGRVRQRIKAAEARAEGALAIYEQTALLALEETENSLVTFGREQQRLAYLLEAERAAAEATELARQRYRDGITDFLSVLDAERTLLSLQEQLAVSQTRAATSVISVFKSFAGQL